jgi:hypothetical protein
MTRSVQFGDSDDPDLCVTPVGASSQVSVLIESGTFSSNPEQRAGGLSVVVSSFQDLDFIIVCSVYEPMFVVDAPGPVPGQLPLERLWLSNPSGRVTLDFSDEPSDPTGQPPVGG